MKTAHDYEKGCTDLEWESPLLEFALQNTEWERKDHGKSWKLL